MKVYYVKSNSLSKSSIYKLQVSIILMMRHDESEKKLNKHICHGCTVTLLLLIYPMSLSADFFIIPNHHKGGAIMIEGD